MRSHHDMGGAPGGAVVRDEHEYESGRTESMR